MAGNRVCPTVFVWGLKSPILEDLEFQVQDLPVETVGSVPGQNLLSLLPRLWFILGLQCEYRNSGCSYLCSLWINLGVSLDWSQIFINQPGIPLLVTRRVAQVKSSQIWGLRLLQALWGLPPVSMDFYVTGCGPDERDHDGRVPWNLTMMDQRAPLHPLCISVSPSLLQRCF